MTGFFVYLIARSWFSETKKTNHKTAIPIFLLCPMALKTRVFHLQRGTKTAPVRRLGIAELCLKKKNFRHRNFVHLSNFIIATK